MSDCSDVETTESDRPLLYLFRNYFKNSHGYGKFRGGAGVGFGLMIHHVPWLAMGSFGYGSKFPSTMGIFGGYAVPPVFIRTVGNSNIKTLLAESNTSLPHAMDKVYEDGNPETGADSHHHVTMTIRPMMNGDTFYLPVGGGAGYGDCLERDPENVLRDVNDNITSHWVARNIYKVSYDEQTLRLDIEKTEELRLAARQARLKNARPFDEFEMDWLKLRPLEEALKYYGAYPDPAMGKTVLPPGM